MNSIINAIDRRLRDADRYHFVSEWHARATPDEVIRILAEPLRLPEWWPAVYLHTNALEPGDAAGIGQTILLVTKGWLPYTLRWRLTVASKQESSLLLVADGDFVGSGRWTLVQVEDAVRIRYEWSVVARKPLLRYLSLVLRPLLVRNHHWAMQRGEESLLLELERRRPRAEQRRAVPPPPPATPHHLAPWVLHLLKAASRRPVRGGLAGTGAAEPERVRRPPGGPACATAALTDPLPAAGVVGANACE